MFINGYQHKLIRSQILDNLDEDLTFTKEDLDEHHRLSKKTSKFLGDRLYVTFFSSCPNYHYLNL